MSYYAEYYILLPDHTFRKIRNEEEANKAWLMENRRVALTEMDNILVSTVFLVMDHSFGDTGGPILFETLVSGLENIGDWITRYATWEEAKAGHDRAVAEIQADNLGYFS